MYINIENIEKEGFEVGDLINLLLIWQAYREEDKQVGKKKISSLISTAQLKSYKDLEIVYFIKGRKSDERWEKLRLTKKGKDLIKKFTEEPLSNEAEEAYLYLEKLYKHYDLKDKITYPSKTKEYIQSFLNETGYDLRHFKAALGKYFENNSDKDFILSSKNLIFKPENVYSQKFKLKESPLWGFVEVNLKG